jgi:uncharacterized glyoxalase superfamily protein PhnB
MAALSSLREGAGYPKETAMPAKFIPDGYHSVTPYLTLRGADKVIAFLKKAFNAETVYEPLLRPDGKIMHAEIKIGDSRIMITEESEYAQASLSSLYLYMPDVDSAYSQAIKAGGAKIMEPADMFYGDRTGGVKDSSGNSWYLGTHKEDLSRDELAKRAADFYKEQEKDKTKAA